MTIVSRRLVPFAAVLAVAVTLAVWITASAAVPRSNPQVLVPMHFTTVKTSSHLSPNGATQKKLAGATIQGTDKLVSAGRQIGRDFALGTFINNAGWGLVNIEVRFSHRGRLELQGTIPPSGNTKTFAIIGGTGVFATARGWAVSHGHNVTVTFR
jgi:hypothetical protein